MNISPRIQIPAEILNQHIAVLGKTGSGKSSALRLIVEGLLDINKPLTIIDPKGDWWGLKSSASGKRAGYPVVIFGGKHEDVPINDRSGAQVAELLATGNRPAIVDVSQMTVGARTRFYIDFAEAFFRHTSGMRWLLIDEVHNFAPKGKVYSAEAGMMLHWSNRIASEGRGKGINLMVASQRPQKVHNDLLSECETLIAMRLVHPRAREAVKEWMDGAGDKMHSEQILSSLASMQRGKGWVWSPEIGFGPEQVVFPMFSTYDSFKPGAQRQSQLPGWSKVDLKEVKEKLAIVLKEHDANDPKLLKLEIADLKKKLAGKIIAPADPLPKEIIDRAYDKGMADGRADLAHSLTSEFRKIETTVGATLVRLGEIKDRAVAKAGDRGQRAVAALIAASSSLSNRVSPPRLLITGPGVEMKAMTRAFLTALAQHPEGLSKGQILVHTGYRASGDVSSQFAALVGEAWVEKILGGNLRITPTGAKALGTYDPLPLGDELRASLLSGGNGKLSRLEKALLESICKAHPHPIAKGTVLIETGYKASGDVSSAFAKLVALGYASKESSGHLKAADELFG